MLALFAVFSVLCLSISDAQAQTTRLYFGGYLGLPTFNDMDFGENSGSGDLEVKNGLAFAGALGVRFKGGAETLPGR